MSSESVRSVMYDRQSVYKDIMYIMKVLPRNHPWKYHVYTCNCRVILRMVNSFGHHRVLLYMLHSAITYGFV